jgi:hypothetical protein
MHLENLYLEASGSNDSKQRDRYSQLIAMIKETSFANAYAKYRQIALADTDSALITAEMAYTARKLACRDLDLPLVD